MAAPEIQRGSPSSNQLPYGAATALNDAMEATGANEAPPGASPPGPPPGMPPPNIKNRPGVAQEESPLPAHVQPFADAVFGPSNRPDEPITEGAPFGPGSNFVDTTNLTPEEELRLTARAVLSNPKASSRAKAYFTRVLNGE